ncbi:MAG: hypothetical protein QOD06_2006 [Candidatus Binatota bacterium]|nr:hypothetical protein [Candidatus Binatota bacterium]
MVVWVRWAFTVALAYLILFVDATTPREWPVLAFVAVLLATNVILPRLPHRRWGVDPNALWLAIETVLVLCGLIVAGEASRDLLIGYFLCIAAASLGDSEERLAGVAFLVTGGYALSVFRSAEEYPGSFWLRIAFLFTATIFYGHLMQRIRAERHGRLRAEARARGLDCLLQLTRSFSSSLSTQQILERVTEAVRVSFEVDRCRVQLLASAAAEGIDPIAGEALERLDSVMRAGESSRATLALPIVYDEEPLGVLILDDERSGEGFAPEEVEFCQVIANTAGLALKNAQQYENLADLERVKSEFLANLSHEMRTPLHAIIGYGELASRELAAEDVPPVRHFLRRISDRAVEMCRHVDNLLRLSRVTLGREERRTRKVNLRTILSQALETARRLADPQRIDFRLDLDPAVGEVFADGEKLQRIVESLLVNAVKFTERGSIQLAASLAERPATGEATLRSRAQPWERLLSVTVRDTGIGMSEGDLEKLFQEFRQANGSTTRPFSGLGLGLAVCQRLTEILGGRIEVRSRPGEGSTFQVILPIRIAAAQPG